MNRIRTVVFVLAAVCVLALPSRADAYIGPGAGITVIGTVVAFFAAIFFAIVGFIWYPIKRLIAFFRARAAKHAADHKPLPS
jgi:hypothetical protein